MLIRTAKEGDAEALLWLLKRLDDETRFMMYEPGERTTTVREQGEFLRSVLAGTNGTVLLAEVDASGKTVFSCPLSGGAGKEVS